MTGVYWKVERKGRKEGRQERGKDSLRTNGQMREGGRREEGNGEGGQRRGNEGERSLNICFWVSGIILCDFHMTSN